MVGSPSTSPRLHLRPPLLLNHRPLLLRRWRSAAAPCASLLLLSLLRRFLKWAFLGRCHLQTLTHTGDTEPYRSLVSPGTLSKPCIGRSNYPLIFVTSSFAILGRRVHRRPGQISELPCRRILRGFFARNPHGTAAAVIVILLLLFGSSDGSKCCLSCILYPVLGTTSSEWSVLELEKFQIIVCLVAFKGQVFGLDPHRRLMAVEFVPNMSWRLLEVPPPPEILDEYHYPAPLPHKTHAKKRKKKKKKVYLV